MVAPSLASSIRFSEDMLPERSTHSTSRLNVGTTSHVTAVAPAGTSVGESPVGTVGNTRTPPHSTLPIVSQQLSRVRTQCSFIHHLLPSRTPLFVLPAVSYSVRVLFTPPPPSMIEATLSAAETELVKPDRWIALRSAFVHVSFFAKGTNAP